LQVHRFPFLWRQPKSEIWGKSAEISLHLLIEPLYLNAIQPRQIRIQHHALATQHDDAIRYRFDFRQRLHYRKSRLAEAPRHVA
jgi:hypothetical protein